MFSITEMPEPIDKTLYDVLVKRFVEQSSGYVQTLYSAGYTNFPGLSDIDLLVIPQKRLLSPLMLRLEKRFPQKFSSIIHHHPFILPEENRDVFRYSFLENLKLVFGRDQIATVVPEHNVTTMCAAIVEGFYSYNRFYETLKSQQQLRARYCVPIFSSFRFTLRLCQACDILLPQDYGVRFDILRTKLMAEPDPAIVWEMYQIFENALTKVRHLFQEEFDFDPESVTQIQHPKALISSGLVDHDIWFRRRQAIQHYQDTLSRLNFFYGSLFTTETYKIAPISRTMWTLNKLASLLARFKR